MPLFHPYQIWSWTHIITIRANASHYSFTTHSHIIQSIWSKKRSCRKVGKKIRFDCCYALLYWLGDVCSMCSRQSCQQWLVNRLSAKVELVQYHAPSDFGHNSQILLCKIFFALSHYIPKVILVLAYPQLWSFRFFCCIWLHWNPTPWQYCICCNTVSSYALLQTKVLLVTWA